MKGILDSEGYAKNQHMEFPQFELSYEVEAKDHLVKVNDWLKATGMDAEWEVILPQSNQLFLDYDSSLGEYFPEKNAGDELPYLVNAPESYSSAMKTMEEAYNVAAYAMKFKITVSKSRHQHCVVTFPEHIKFSPMEAAAWQAAAGSDPKREALHIKSILMGSKNPNLLIEKKA